MLGTKSQPGLKYHQPPSQSYSAGTTNRCACRQQGQAPREAKDGLDHAIGAEADSTAAIMYKFYYAKRAVSGTATRGAVAAQEGFRFAERINEVFLFRVPHHYHVFCALRNTVATAAVACLVLSQPPISLKKAVTQLHLPLIPHSKMQ